MTMTIEELCGNLLTRMREIDSDISRSLYQPVAISDNDDRPPDGDDYNLLWDAVLDELRAAGIPTDLIIAKLGRR